MPFLVLPETAQASAALAILRAFSRLALTSARSAFVAVSRAIASMGGSFRHHTCLLCRGSRAECGQSYCSFARAGSSSDERVSWPKWAQEQVCLLPDSGRVTAPQRNDAMGRTCDPPPQIADYLLVERQAQSAQPRMTCRSTRTGEVCCLTCGHVPSFMRLSAAEHASRVARHATPPTLFSHGVADRAYHRPSGRKT